ncbi:ParA family protein [Priestia aryabhattai]|uniref:ParA family protein n=1 Tax=Priestia aryabhattai TaxID=412384 RepID=UPI003983CDE8
MGEIITVTISKGGVLKTSIVSNLGGAIAKSYADKKVLLIETDPQGNLSDTFGINTDKLDYSMFDVYMGEKTFDEVKIPILKNLDIVPAKMDLNDLDYRIWTTYKDEGLNPFNLLKDAIQDVREAYDYIIIDTPPAYSLNVGNVFNITDKVIIPLQLEPYAIKGLKKALEMVDRFNERRKTPIEVLGVIATLVRTTALHGELMKQTRQYCSKNDIRMFDTVIRQAIKFAESIATDKKPAILLDKLSSKEKEVVNVYYELMEELVNE